MRKIPLKLKDNVLEYAKRYPCLRREVFEDHECKGRTTLEHALIYAGRQVNEDFAIVPLCALAHSVDDYQGRGILDKEKNHFLALARASELDLQAYPKSDWKQKKKYLENKYWKYLSKVPK